MQMILRQREGKSNIDQVGEGSPEQNFPEAAVSVLFGFVSCLIKWCVSLVRILTSTEVGQSTKE